MQTKMKGINEFFLSRMDGMNEVKFNAECSPDLLMTALGYPCIRQEGETKYYRVTNSAARSTPLRSTPLTIRGFPRTTSAAAQRTCCAIWTISTFPLPTTAQLRPAYSIPYTRI